jgi:hypothetical protein
MIIKAQETINGSKESVWAVISDIDNAANAITGISEVEILERPDVGLVGLKWKETRTLFGKTATEVMWITDSVENEFYKTRAESHGNIYLSTLRVVSQDDATLLTMTHESKPQGFLASLISVPMMFIFKGMLKKCLAQDLRDIKAVVEKD